MKFRFTYLIISLVLTSCNEEQRLQNYSQNHADQFIEKHSEDFLKDEELLKYSYHPRAQFTFSQDSTNSYGVFPRENEVRLICFSDSCELTESFNKSPLTLSNGKYTLKQDSIFTEISYDSALVKLHSFKLNPEDYFNELKKRIVRYGVFAYSESQDKSFIKVYFSVQYYLIHSKQVLKDINNDEIIKSYKDNWYFVKMERQMDLG